MNSREAVATRIVFSREELDALRRNAAAAGQDVAVRLERARAGRAGRAGRAASAGEVSFYEGRVAYLRELVERLGRQRAGGPLSLSRMDLDTLAGQTGLAQQAAAEARPVDPARIAFLRGIGKKLLAVDLADRSQDADDEEDEDEDGGDA